jgi:hypothetical protein
VRDRSVGRTTTGPLKSRVKTNRVSRSLPAIARCHSTKLAAEFTSGILFLIVSLRVEDESEGQSPGVF